MLLPFTIQFHLIVALLASMCGDQVVAAPGPVHDDHTAVVLAEAADTADHIDADAPDPEGPSGDGILADVRIWSLWPCSGAWDFGATPHVGDAARRRPPSRAPPALRCA
ncbi:MAG TPA: hypothetical protein P5081_04830 [Phycisphaerae bacterium]|nr:hypothetical protein [Phycisphaerae bacterium]HRW52188.1 hypothetical protein [Phycisphaerae bacterium]